KLMLIGVVALVVIGPEKLPRVARTAGALLGRAQRYVTDIKAEVAQQMNVDELNEMKKTVEDAARSAQESMKKMETSMTKEAKDVESTMSKSLHDTQSEVEKVWNADGARKPYTPSEPETGKLESLPPPHPQDIQSRLQALKVPSTPPVQAHMPDKVQEPKAVSGVRKNQSAWRAQRAATPLWYKRRTCAKDVLRSDAARFLEKNG
ncbi:MAG: Sec-independent protein translocase protein TatB, partial [Saezia sp.]